MKEYIFPDLDDNYGICPPQPIKVGNIISDQESVEVDHGPYLSKRIVRTFTTKEWNPDYNQNAICQCGHAYERHFDPYEMMYPIGCKYCECNTFIFS